MKKLLHILLFVSCLIPSIVNAENFQLGETVLANCHGFYAKGKIKRKHKDKYVVHFNKDARPIMCVPFAWDAAFLVAYKPIDRHMGTLVTGSGVILNSTADLMLKIGDLLQVKFKVLERDAMFSDKYTATVKIKEINGNGSALLEVVSGETKAKQAFERWVGTNYVGLDFSNNLKADRLTILEVKK